MQSQPDLPAPRKGSATIPIALAYLAGATFTVASAATNVTYALARYDNTISPQSVIWAAVAVAASVALALAPTAFVNSLGSRRYGAAILSALAALIFGAYSVTAALGSATGGRLIADVEASDVAHKRKAAADAIQTASSELAKLASARPVAELDAAIAKELATRNDLNDCIGWLPSTKARTICVDVSELRAERGRAERRAQLETAIHAAHASLATLSPRKTVANADALALQGLAAAAGLVIDVDALNQLLVVLAILIVELGGGLAFALGSALTTQSLPAGGRGADGERGIRRVSLTSDQPMITTDQSPSQIATIIESDQGLESDQNSDHSPRNRLVTALMANGGSVHGSQRLIAGQIGVSQSRLNQLLVELRSAGLIKTRAGSTGTTVQLVAAGTA